MKVPRDMRTLVRLARAQGWELAPSGAGHLAWYSPTGALVVSSASPSDWRA